MEYGKLWPGMIFRVGTFDSTFEAQYKMKVKMCKTWKEAEEWILAQKEKDGDKFSK